MPVVVDDDGDDDDDDDDDNDGSVVAPVAAAFLVAVVECTVLNEMALRFLGSKEVGKSSSGIFTNNQFNASVMVLLI